VAKLSVLEPEGTIHPIDTVEEVMLSYEWSFERQGEDEIAVQITGQWCDLHMWFAWRSETHSLFYTCALDMRVPDERREVVYPLLAKINEKLWFGHFELWSEGGWPTFRHTLLAGRGSAVGADLVEEMVDAARSECDRFYPAFQFVIWGGKDAEGAIEAALIEPIGEA